MSSSVPLPRALLTLIAVLCPAASHEQSLPLLFADEIPAREYRDIGITVLVGRDDTRAEPSKDGGQDNETRPARTIKQFTAPTIQLKGTAEEIGLDSAMLAGFLEARFLKEFGFLQDDFAFEKTYETWEIGLFECEVWTVGNNYPIALHVECTGGSMDEPRHWHYAMLGYGPKEKILGIVTKALESIVVEYGTFVRRTSSL